MFVKGQSGNPGGRPKKGLSFSDLIRKEAEEVIELDGQKLKQKTLVVNKLYEMALAGDIKALKYLMDRIDGTPKQTMDVGVQDGRLGFNIEFDSSTEAT